MRLLTSAEARELDSGAVALGISPEALMEAAGAKAALVACRLLGRDAAGMSGLPGLRGLPGQHGLPFPGGFPTAGGFPGPRRNAGLRCAFGPGKARWLRHDPGLHHRLGLRQGPGPGFGPPPSSGPGSAPGRKVLVLAGRGNNGGDGLVMARYLRNAGCEVKVYLCGGAGLRPEGARNLRAWRESGGWTSSPDTEPGFWTALEADLRAWCDLAVDALLGIGQTEPPREGIGRAASLLAGLAAGCDDRTGGRPLILAIDLPTGIDADNGRAFEPAVRADVTVTFGLPKIGLFQHLGAIHAGALVVADIGLPAGFPGPPAELAGDTAREPAAAVPAATGGAAPAATGAAQTWLCNALTAARMLPGRTADFHKGDAGTVVAVGGSVGMAGAAALMSRGAVRAGAGLVTVATPASALPVVAAGCVEAMTFPLAEEDGAVAASAVEAAVGLAAGAGAVALGPGLRRTPGAASFARDFVRRCPRPLVLDADGLFAFAGAPDLLARRDPAVPLVITPHPGELAALMGTDVAAVQRDRLGAARRAAAATRAVCLLKGHATVIAEPGGRAWLVPAGNPAMATGGMGDVLTGVVAAVWARAAADIDRGRRTGTAGGLAGPVAAAAALWHALAGDLAAIEVGGPGLKAGDVARRLPAARELIVRPGPVPWPLRRSLTGACAFV